MTDIIELAAAWSAAGQKVALATVVRVDGSAPRGEGAKMIVSDAGRIAGSVSGGCVEAAVAEAAQAVFDGSPPRIENFGISRAMAWDVGLTCGGSIDVMIEKLPDLETLRTVFTRGSRAALCTPFAESGFKNGQKAVVFADGRMQGSCGDPDFDAALAVAAREQIEQGSSRTRSVFDCDVFIDVGVQKDRLIIVGAVHIAAALCELAARAGFSVTVIDPRERLNHAERFPLAVSLLVGWPEDVLEGLALDDDTYVAILSHDEKFDDPSIRIALRATPRYIGAIGSKKTHAARRERLAQFGFTNDAIDRVRAPIGLDIGAQTPEEIAVAVLAEMIAAKHGHSGAPLRDRVEQKIHT
ncbi:MAG TPA: XdhC/CoxI family protein [Candidatus Eremiobacteraceae bacterium]|nr:XdhC/CoxI family protein [Candidatus Eremiobacteraceae bacterium]